jgi:uncharacterized protein (TIGR02145 family)
MYHNHTVGAYCIRPIFAAILLLICATAFAQQKTKNVVTVEVSYTDPRDGKTYKTAKIGEQVWLAENLNYAADSSRCYNDSTAYCEKYGRLYNWETAIKACPSGWHLPSQKEWHTLVKFAGGYEIAGKKLKAVNGWNKDDNGTDEFGFSALPGGYGSLVSEFFNVGGFGHWWSSNERNDAYNIYISNKSVGYSSHNVKSILRSVRCIENPQPKPTITDKEIQSVIDANMPEVQNIKRIYGKYLGKEPNATLILAIAPSGEIIKTEIIYSAADTINFDKLTNGKENDVQWKVIKINNKENPQ